MRPIRLLARPAAGLALCAAIAPTALAAEIPVFDAHLHYSHDAWAVVPPKEAAALLRKAGLKRALVSSSNDDGTQMLFAEAPDIVLPSLRPYRSRGDISTWTRDETLPAHLAERLARYRYVAIGEFHVYGADADLPVVRRVVELARAHGLFLHAHSDVEAVERLFRQDPQARVLWAHSGFERPEKVREMLRRYPRLWADLAFRTDHASGGKVHPDWREAFLEFPDRFLVGTDTFTPERWHYVGEHARWSREWLADLPPAVAERLAWKNGEALFSASCPPELGGAGGTPVDGEGVAVSYRTTPERIEVGRHFALEIATCARAGGLAPALTAVDAHMPEHRHGMNYRPSLREVAPGRYRAEGLMFHMPGRWELVFETRAGATAQRLARTIDLD